MAASGVRRRLEGQQWEFRNGRVQAADTLLQSNAGSHVMDGWELRARVWDEQVAPTAISRTIRSPPPVVNRAWKE